MVKGCEKRMIRWKSPDSRVFEEVLFVLRDGERGMAERDIVAEATRILSEGTAACGQTCPRRPSLIPFLCGVACAAAALLPFLLR